MKFTLPLLVLMTAACTTIQSTSLSNVSLSNGTRLIGRETAGGVFRITIPNIDDMTNNVLTKIKKGCEKGSLHNVQTTLSMQEAIFVQTYEVAVTATCVTQ